MKVRVSKFRTNSFVISKRDARSFTSSISALKGESGDAKLRIGDRSFFPRVRTDGRIEIPKGIIKKRQRVVDINIVKANRGDIIRSRKKLEVANKYRHGVAKFYFARIEDFIWVDRDGVEHNENKLKDELAKDIFALQERYKWSSADVYYIRLHFLEENDDGSFYVWVATLTEQTVGSESYKAIRNFVYQKLDEAFIHSRRSYVSQVTLIKASIAYTQDISVYRQMREKERREGRRT